jgi:hypothetical protein
MDIPEKLATLDIEHRNEEKQNRKKKHNTNPKKMGDNVFFHIRII